MKRISFFYVVSFFSIIGLLFASVSYAANEKDLLALSIAAAQEAQEAVDVGQKITLDEDFAPEDFGLTGVGILPTSPFYFFKGIRRTVQSAFTFDPVAEAELKIRFSAEKLLETKAVAGTEGASSDDITYALENFQEELQRVTDRTKDAADGLEEGEAVELTKKLMDFTVKCQKSLGKIEKTLPPELFEDIKLAKEKTSETFGSAFDLVEPEKVTEELVGVFENQKGSEFKDFKNIEILKEIEENVPEQAKDAVRLAQGQALTRLQGELEKLQFAKRAVFEDFVREIGGSGVQQLEIITDLEAQPLSADVREVLAGVKEEALSKTDKRLQTLTQPQQEKFLEHLAQGEIKNVRVLKELEQNVSKGVLQGILQAKGRAKGNIVEKVKESEFQEKGKQELFGELEQSHDAGSLAVLDEIEALIPSDKKAFFSELKQKAVVEIKRDVDRAGTASQRQVIFAALAGDHPEQFGVIDRFQKEVDVPFDFGSIWEGMRKAQAERFEMRTESIKDRERLGRLEEEFGKQKEEFKEFRKFEDLFRTRRNVFDSPERAQAQIREAEERIAELDKIIDSLPFDVSFEEGKFDPFLAEIERLLEVAEQKLKAARDVVSQQPGRAFGFANAAADIARHGIRMAEEYKSGRKEVRCPFFFPPPQNFCQNGRVVSDIDQNGCQLPPRCEFVERCPFPTPPPFNFCSNGRIVYEKSPQGCPLPPRCEEFRTCPLIVDPKPCPEGSYRDGFYRDGCFVYGECRPAEKQYFNCGGIAGLKCPNGFRCEMPTPTYPDAMGECIPTIEKPITCQAYWSGFIYRPETNSCVKEGTSGCSDPYVFHTQEECDKANKITICPSMPTVDSCPAGQRKVVTFSSPQCGTYYGCVPDDQTGKPQCSDGIDNDSDGLIDYPKDTGCYGADDTTETPYVGGNCLSYATQTSCQTSGCTWYANHHDGTHCDDTAHGQGTPPGGKPQCSDGIDNDNDGKIDYPADTSCYDGTDNDEWYPSSTTTTKCTAFSEATCNADAACKWVTGFGCGVEAQCNDGIDNDNDGLIDHPKDTGCYDAFDNDEAYTAGAYCGDKSCSGSETATSCPTDCGSGTFTCNNNKVCESNENYTSCPGDCGGTICSPETCYDPKYCTDGIDNDNDGLIDSKDPGCGGTTGGYCGDKICNNAETAASCSIDCGGTTTADSCPNYVTEPTCHAAELCVWSGSSCSKTGYIGSATSCPGFSYSKYDSTNTRYCELNNAMKCEFFHPAYLTVANYSQTECPAGAYCGDKSCSGSETAASCPIDCGGTTTKPQCSDGIDNDTDGLIDYPADTGCYGSDDTTETPYAPTGCMSYTSSTSCQSAACTWYTNHYDGSHCDDAAHGGSTTTFTCDNDKICEANENYTSCPGDCGGSTTTTCSSPSTCTTSTSCAGAGYYWCMSNSLCYSSSSSCPTSGYCGDGTCGSSETSTSCWSDCGSTTACNNNGICDSGESIGSCQSDCGSTTSNFCGDHICNGAETSATCPGDCGTTTTTTTTTCTSGYYWDSATQACKPSSSTICPSGQYWDSAASTCKTSTTSASLFTPFLKLLGF